MLSIEQTNKAITVGLRGKEATYELMLAAIEGAIMGAMYRNGTKVDDKFIAYAALRTMVEGVERLQRAEKLGL